MSRIRLFTLNACFEVPETYNRRFNALCSHILKEQYDVVCLQESVDELFEKVTSRLKELYWISPKPLSAPYYTLMLCKRELFDKAKPPMFERHRLPTRMGRDLLVVDIPRGGGKVLTCATTHLESEDSHSVREQQMRKIDDLLETKPNVVLMGDFNFAAHRNYRPPWKPLQNDSLAVCLPSFVDAWCQTNGKASGFTFMHERNQWKFEDKSNARGGFRFDRIMVKFACRGPFKINSMQITCEAPIGTRGGEIESPLYMSDHLGLTISVDDANQAPVFNNGATSSSAQTSGSSATMRKDASSSQSKQKTDSDSEVEIIEPEDVPKQTRNRARVEKSPSVLSEEEKKEESKTSKKLHTSMLAAHVDNVETFLGNEPPSGPGVITVALKLPSGKRAQRRFHIHSEIESLYWWACSLDSSLFQKPEFKIKFDALVAGSTPFDFGTVHDIPSGTLESVPGLDRATLRVV